MYKEDVAIKQNLKSGQVLGADQRGMRKNSLEKMYYLVLGTRPRYRQQ